MKTNSKNEALDYWEFNYNREFRRELIDRWDEIEETLIQPENVDVNLELRKTVALEKIADYLEQISENGLLTYEGRKYYNSKKDETTQDIGQSI